MPTSLPSSRYSQLIRADYLEEYGKEEDLVKATALRKGIFILQSVSRPKDGDGSGYGSGYGSGSGSGYGSGSGDGYGSGDGDGD